MSGAEHLGPYLLEVKEGVFPLGGDSLALGAFATVKRGWRVCDLGTGSGCLLLMLAAREGGLSLTGVEREERAAQCARENLAHSGLEGTVLQADWRQVTLPAGGFDLVISNPPYFQPAVPHRGPPAEKQGAVRPVPPAGAAGGPDVRPAGERPGAQTDAAAGPWAGASPLLCSDGGGAPGAARSADRTVRGAGAPNWSAEKFQKNFGPHAINETSHALCS